MKYKLALPIILLSMFMTGVFAVQWFRNHNRVHYLTLATGDRNGQDYAFGQALAKVVAKHCPQIQIEVLATKGSLENLELLEEKKVQLAILKRDTTLTPSTKAISFLFPEMFHLIAHQKSGIGKVSDLKGKRIALMPKGSSSYALFWPLSQHYGLTETDFQAVSLLPEQAHAALLQGKVDALFRVIALGNPAVSQLLQNSQTQLVPIGQGAALQLFQPTLETSQIPKGTYNGEIPIPIEDLPVVAVRAMLVTNQDMEPSIIHEITRLLFEARDELVKENPQAAMIEQTEPLRNLGLSFHPGAKAYYNQNQPSFIVEYAEPLGLLLSISVLCVSSIWQLRIRLQGRQKNRADFYNLEILKLINQIQSLEDLEQSAAVRRHLFEIFEKVVVELDKDRISPEPFQSFTFPWEVAMRTLRHREILLSNRRSPAEFQKEVALKK